MEEYKKKNGMPMSGDLLVDESREALIFLGELRRKGFIVLYENDMEYNPSDKLLHELWNAGNTIYRIDFEIVLVGEQEELTIYCKDGNEKAAIEWIFENWSDDLECLNFKELESEYPYAKCRWNSPDDLEAFEVPVRLPANKEYFQMMKNVN